MTPVLLSIAGSDSGGGAGIQADLKTFAAHGVFGTTAITAITAQDTAGVYRVDPVPVAGVRAQIRAVLDDFPVAAIKIGMLGTADITRAVAEALLAYTGPLVVDPVMVATSGHRLLTSEAEDALRALCHRATLITPNRAEARVLSGGQDVEAWARDQPYAVLLTGGDTATQDVIDTLSDGERTTHWRGARLPDGPFHGTGCTLSSAIACHLARGLSLQNACDTAIDWVREQIAQSEPLGQGSRVLLHR